MGSGAIGSGQGNYPRKVYRTRIKRAAGAALRGYERVDRAALRFASYAIPAKTRQHIQAQRELFDGDIHLAVPVGRERALAVRIPDRLKYIRHAILPVAVLVTLLVALQANASVTGYGGTHTVSATGDQIAHEAQAYNDSLYVSGILQGSADFGTSYGLADTKAAAGSGSTVYVSKTTAGSYNWTRVLTDDVDAVSLAASYAGANGASGGEAVYVTGQFTGEVNFAADFGSSDIKTAVGTQDGYITRINADGSYGWTYTFGASGTYAQPSGITYDPSTAVVVVTGTFGGDMQFGPSSPLRTAGGSNGFVLWLDDAVTSATYARDYHLVSSTSVQPSSIAATSVTANQVLVGGQFETDATFEMGGSPAAAPSTGSDGFLLRLGLDGTYANVQTFGGTGQESVDAIHITPNDTVYVGGTMTGGTTFRDLGAVAASASATDGFILQVSPSDVNTWVRVLGGDNAQVAVEGINVGSDGMVYAAGSYSGSVDFKKSFGSGDVQQSHGTSNAFLTTFSDAAYEATYSIGAEVTDDPAGEVTGYAIAGSNPDELLYIVGTFTETINFGLPFSETDTHVSSGGTDAYVTAIVTREPRTLSGGGLQYFDEDTNLSSSGTQELSPLVTVQDDDDTYLAELTVDMAEDRAWTTTGDTDHVGHKSVIANLTNQEGASTIFTFYVPKGVGDKAVAVCPGTETLVAVALDCATRQTFVEGAGATTQSIAGTDYWVLEGRTETSIGGMSLAYPGLAITPPAGGLSITEGSDATFSIALQATPTDDVTLTPNVDVPAQLNGGSSLTFTTENWQTPQDLVLTAVDDQLVDGPVDVTLSWALTSTDGNYNGAAEPSIVLQVLDNDTAGINWSPASLLLNEAGLASDLCIALTAQPTDTVTLALSSSDTSEANVSSPLVIAPGDWDAATNCATVTPVDDDETDGSKDAIISVTSITSDDTAFSSMSTGSLATVTTSVQDDDIAGFIFSASGTSQTTESGGTDQICVALTAMPLANVTVPVSSSDTSEGTLSSTELVIAPEDWDAVANCITVTGQDDDLIDGNIAYSVLTGDPTSADPAWDALGEADTTNPSLTNLDDDNAGVTVSESNLTITEGGLTDTFQVNLQSQPAPGQEVHVAITSSNTGQLTSSPSTLTFTGSDWSSPQTVTVTAVDDGLLENTHEGNLTVSVLESTTEEPYLLLGDQVIATDITDNDSAAATILATSNASENGANGTFTVALSKQNDTTGVIAVNYNVLAGSTAVAGMHYTALSGSANIPVGQDSTTITIDVSSLNNELLEGDRSVQIELTGTSTASVTLGAPSSASVLIIDDETATISLAATPGEEGGNSIVLTATLSRINNTGSSMVFELAEAGGTAAPGTDYTSFDNSSITILDGASTGTLAVVVTDDELLEPTTESVSAELSAFPLPPSVTLDSEDFSAQTTITDNDQAEVTVVASDATEPTTAGSFALQLSKINQTGVPITVTFTVDGTATSGTDFTSIGTTASILDGENNVIVALTPIDDTDIEGDETVGVTLTETDFARALIGIPGSASATITDNETASVVVTTPDDTTSEDGATAQICFELGSRPSSSATIALNSSDTSKIAVPANVTIERDNWDTPTCVSATGQDDAPPVVAGTQDVTIITGEVTSSDTFYDALLGTDVANVTLHHADNDLPSVTMTSIDTVTSEDGTISAHVRYSLSSEPTANVSIPVSVDDATEATLSGVTEVVISPEDWNTPASNELVIYGVDDSLTDGTITYHLVTGTAVSLDGNYNDAAVDDVTLTNTDDDAAGVTVDTSASSVLEGDSLTHTVAITSQPAPGNQVVITAMPINSQIDLGSGAGNTHTLTFTNVDWDAQVVTVSAVDDSLLESAHTSTVAYAIAEGTDEQTYLDYASALPSPTIDITDNDTANAVLSAVDNNEGNGELTFTVTLDKTNNTGASIDFALNTTGGTAIAGTDYTTLTGTTISVPDGSTVGTATVTIADDDDLEGDETVEATISSPSLAAISITGASAAATILDNENADATVAATDADATENSADSGEFTISLSRPNDTGSPISITYEVSGTATSGVDFEALSGSVSIANGESSATVVLVTSANDEVVEGNETITVTLTGSTNTQVNIDATPTTITLHDDDAYNWSITQQSNGAEQGEQAVSFLVSLSKVNTTGGDMTIVLTDPLSGSATKSQDYIPFDELVAIPDGQNEALVTVTITDDNLLESLEDIDAVISSPSEGTIMTASASATVTDNDTANVALSASDGSETGADITYMATLDKANNTSTSITFALSTIGGTATGDEDYAALDAVMVSVPIGSSSASVTSEVVDDTDMEGDETVTASLSSSSNLSVTIAGNTATATISDNDTATASAIAAAPTAYEDGSGSGQVTVQLSRVNKTPAPITLTYAVGGTATSNSDFTELSGSVQIPIDASSATVEVTALDDALAEGSETVVLTLTNTDHPIVSIGGQSAATVTIVDDDSFNWSVATLQNGAENGDSVIFRVQLSQQNITGHSLTATLSDSLDGTGTKDDDYTAFDATVTVPDGASYVDVTVPVLDDSLLERTETIGAALSAPSEGDVSVAAATATISDNETGVLTVEATQPIAKENPSQNGQFTISLDTTNDSSAPIIINYTVGGSATGGQDYAELSGIANIPTGQDGTIVWVDMSGYNDVAIETDETVIITLVSTNHGGIQVGSSSAATATIQSDDVQPADEPDEPSTTPIAPAPRATFVPAPASQSQPTQPLEPGETPPAPTSPVDQTVKDQDSDGIDDTTEAKAHNFGDGNGDGIPDNMQANVSSLISGITQQPVTLAAMGECTDITSFTVIGEDELSKNDLTHRYPHGLVDYTVACEEAGQNAEVAVYYDEQLDGDFTWRKLAQPRLEFQAIDNAQPMLRAVGQGNVTIVSYTVSDGGSLDDDGKADGKILDPAGLASSIFQPRDLLWLTPVLLLAGILVARAGAHHRREHRTNRAKIAKF